MIFDNLQYKFLCAFLHIIRRPSGTDKEFLIQLFVESNANVATVTTEELLKKMFKDNNITFAKVCCDKLKYCWLVMNFYVHSFGIIVVVL